MGKDLTLTSDDGHSFVAYRADPSGTPKGAIMVIQEIFGVNKHIREVCDGFAKDGFVAVAPSLYDRSSAKAVQLGYTPEDVAKGRDLRTEFPESEAVKDMATTVKMLNDEGLQVCSVGYCWGGTMSYLAGVHVPVKGAVVYYGGQIMPHVDEKGGCPMLMHFGTKDQGIPLDDVKEIDAKHPEAEVHTYEADHGFNCDHRGQYDEAAAKQARERTVAFFNKQLG
ncbi:MAG: dienelactone hydrolase family protein [Alphaproteobacteria bacterium]